MSALSDTMYMHDARKIPIPIKIWNVLTYHIRAVENKKPLHISISHFNYGNNSHHDNNRINKMHVDICSYIIGLYNAMSVLSVVYNGIRKLTATIEIKLLPLLQ